MPYNETLLSHKETKMNDYTDESPEAPVTEEDSFAKELAQTIALAAASAAAYYGTKYAVNKMIARHERKLAAKKAAELQVTTEIK
jgi:hypothetical protein